MVNDINQNTAAERDLIVDSASLEDVAISEVWIEVILLS